MSLHNHNSLAIPRLSIPFRIPASWGAGNGKRIGTLPLALLAAAPVVLPAAYLAYVLRQGARRTRAYARISPPDPLVLKTKGGEVNKEEGGDTLAVPADVLAATGRYVIARERVVSEPVPLERIRPELRQSLKDGGGESARGLLDAYLATTMRMFTWTPQAFAMRAMVSRLPGGAAHAETFSAGYLDECEFENGDRVCGVYVVRERLVSTDAEGNTKGERVLLELSAPEGWKGPVVSGVLDCGFVVEEGVVKFVNETVMWREAGGKPTLIEGRISRWFHTLMVGWMMVRGVQAVTVEGKDRTA